MPNVKCIHLFLSYRSPSCHPVVIYSILEYSYTRQKLGNMNLHQRDISKWLQTWQNSTQVYRLLQWWTRASRRPFTALLQIHNNHNIKPSSGFIQDQEGKCFAKGFNSWNWFFWVAITTRNHFVHLEALEAGSNNRTLICRYLSIRFCERNLLWRLLLASLHWKP